MRDVFAPQKASSFLFTAALLLVGQSSVSDAQDGIQSLGSQGPALSVAEDNGRERGGHLDPPIATEPTLVRVVTPPVQRVPADATGQVLIVQVLRAKVPVRRRVTSRGFVNGVRLVKLRQGVFSSDRGG